MFNQLINNIIPLFAMWLVMSVLFVSCNFEDNKTDGVTGRDKISVKMQAVNDISSHLVVAENRVSTVKALVFVSDRGIYKFNYMADVLTPPMADGEITTFSLQLFTTIPIPVKVIIIANADNAFNTANPQFGETEEVIKQRINQNFTVAGITDDFPMWGVYQFPNGISSNLDRTMLTIPILRSIARVDIDASSASSIFQMTSIEVFRANSQMQVIPDAYTTNPLSVVDPSIPLSSIQNIHTNPIAVNSNISLSQLFLPESAAPLSEQIARGATCIVVGGRYNGSSTTTYYRLDFNLPTPGYPLGQILRNHQYTFKIISVNGPGWSTPDDAANNVTSNIMANVIDWTDIYTNININGTNIFSIPTKNTTLGGSINEVSDIDIYTDIENCTLYWSDAAGNPTDNYIGTSIGNDHFAATITQDNIEVQSLAHNDFGNGIREQYFTVVAGRLRIPIKITQMELPFVHQSRWAEFDVDQFGTFASTRNSMGQLYVWDNPNPFALSGAVANWPVSISNSAVWQLQNDPCPQGWRTPSGNELNELLRDYPARRAYTGTDPQNPNSGVWIAPTQDDIDNATFINPGKALFFPLPGIRSSAQNGTAMNNIGIYWSNNRTGNGHQILTTTAIGGGLSNSLVDLRNQTVAYSVRCIRDL